MIQLESFSVDHTKLPAPAVRKAKVITTPKGDKITAYDLRFCKPNIEIMGSEGSHTVEHLFAGFMREHLKGIDVVDISPMGCRTGFYMVLIGEIEEQIIADAWKKSMEDILMVDTIPELNEYQCGTYKMHSLDDAKEIAKGILSKNIGIVNKKDVAISDDLMAKISGGSV